MTTTNESNQKFIEQIQRGIAHFDEYEMDSYSDEILIAFARKDAHMIKYLPKNRMSYDVLKAVIENDQLLNALEYISSKDTPNYKDFSIMAVAKSWTQLKHVEKEFVDADFFNRAIEKSPKAIHAFLMRYTALVEENLSQQDLQELLDTGAFNRNVVIRGIVTGKLKTSLISDAYIQKALLAAPSLLPETLKSEYKPLAIALLTQGEWPAEHASEKPHSLQDAVKRLKKSGKSPVSTWHQAYIMTFGVEKAVKAMKAPGTIELLEAIYSREEILPHLSGVVSKKTKGKWLEDSLGL